MEPDEYEAKTGVPFLRSAVKPNPYNTTIPNVASLRIQTQCKAKYKENVETLVVFCAAEGNIKNFIREKFKDTFLKELKGGIKGY